MLQSPLDTWHPGYTFVSRLGTGELGAKRSEKCFLLVAACHISVVLLLGWVS